MCHQAASFNRCLFKVQRDMQTQLKTVRIESKGKGPSKASEAAEELQFLMEFNSSISQAAAKVMEHLTDFVFITMRNLTLARRDAYLNHVKNGIKPDTLAALRIVPLHISTLFPDAVIKQAEEEITHYDNKGQSTSLSSHYKGRFHPYERSSKKAEGRLEAKQERPVLGDVSLDEVEARTLTFHHNLPRASSHTNDNHCITRSQDRLLARSTCTEQTMNIYFKPTVKLNVVNVVPSAPGHFQKRELSPGSESCYYKNHRLKYVKSASCATQLPQICL